MHVRGARSIMLAMAAIALLVPAESEAQDPSAGGIAFAAREADAVWITGDDTSFTGVAAQADQEVAPLPDSGGWIDTFRIFCEDDYLIVRETWNSEALPMAIDPLLATASVTGSSSTGEGFQVSWPDCDGTTDDGREERDLTDVPISVDAQFTATGQPTTFSVIGHDADPINGCVDAIAAGGLDRVATATAKVNDVPQLGEKDLDSASMTEYAAGFAGAGATAGCSEGATKSRLARWQQVLAAGHPRWAARIAGAIHH